MTHATRPLTGSYHRPDGGWDEMLSATGAVRDHWSHVGGVLDTLGPVELARRRAEAATMLEDAGVTHGGDGGWALDPVPAILTSKEWAAIEAGVVQRAELLDLVLADLYGPRELLRRSVLPPEVVFGHSGFLRPCDGIRLRGDHQLVTVAVDLVRGGDGSHRVLADRAQAPAGAAYALEHRAVLSRVFPSMYRDAQVHRLVSWLRTLRHALRAVAPGGRDDARLVVLTPGLHSETAFEHGALAAQLGCDLVEGSDLAVEGGRVWMRALGRPQAVDVVLRRVDASHADPLELRGDSLLGVPGLVEACRRGSVAVVNGLGSGVLDNAGLLPFLPTLARKLLGEPLLLPSVTTWWCGDPHGRSHVLAHLDRLVVKPLSPDAGPAVFGGTLDAARREELCRRIEDRPGAWIGQEDLAAASVPTLGPDGLEPRRSVLRTFAVAGADSYVVMPGGLTRVAGPGAPLPGDRAATLCKDTWVLASEPERSEAPVPPGAPPPGVAPDDAMSSRAAEQLVWLGRYAERAEAALRLLRVVHDRRNELAEVQDPAGLTCLRALLVAVTSVTATYPGFVGAGAEERLADPGPELESLAVDAGRVGSLAFAVARLVAAANAAREQLSIDTGLVVNSLNRNLLDVPSPGRVAFHRVLTSLLALEGLGAESMVRDAGWWLLDAGRRIERGMQLATLLRSTVTTGHDDADGLILESVLTAAESIITHRRRYRSRARLESLVDLLVLDAGNPRSLAHQVERLGRDLAELPNPASADLLSALRRPALDAASQLAVADAATLATRDATGRRPALDRLLERVGGQLAATADALAAAYFPSAPAPRAVLTPAGSAPVGDGPAR